MAIKFEFEDNGLIMVRGSGVLTREAFDDAKKQVIAHIKQCGRVYILIRIEEDFTNLEASATWRDDQDDEFIQRYVSRLAIVGEAKWSEDALLFFLSGLLPFPIKYFKFSEEELAKAWLIDY